jgi:catechol-2,3-dioxygenase
VYIKELSILSGDLSETEKFYTEILQLESCRKSPGHISFRAGSTLLTFTQSAHKNSKYHFAFNIPNNRLNEALASIENKVEILPVEGGKKIMDFRNWNARSIYFKDSTGNILEFIARFDLNNQNRPDSGDPLILSISEIGISVNDVLEESRRLKIHYPVDFFTKQQPGESFAALGDDNGLLILSKHRRNWFPTDYPSEKLWTFVKFETGGETHRMTWYNRA